MNPQVKVGVSMIAGMGLVAFGVLYGMAGITDIDPGDVGPRRNSTSRYTLGRPSYV